jgi:hypothetical protein
VLVAVGKVHQVELERAQPGARLDEASCFGLEELHDLAVCLGARIGVGRAELLPLRRREHEVEPAPRALEQPVGDSGGTDVLGGCVYQFGDEGCEIGCRGCAVVHAGWPHCALRELGRSLRLQGPRADGPGYSEAVNDTEQAKPRRLASVGQPLAAVLGASIVALATFFATLSTQGGENDRAENRVQQQTKGAARSLVYQLQTATIAVDESIKEGYFFKPATGYTPRLPQADLELIISRLSSREYGDLTRALASISSVAPFLRARVGKELGGNGGPGPRRPTPGGQFLRQYAAQGVRAINALADVADLDHPAKDLAAP